MSWKEATVYLVVGVLAFIVLIFTLVVISEGIKARAEGWKTRYQQRDKDYNELLAAHRAILERQTTT